MQLLLPYQESPRTKPQSLKVLHGVPFSTPTATGGSKGEPQEQKSGVGQGQQQQQQQSGTGEGRAKGSSSSRPAWFEYWGKVLSFDAYFVERLADVQDAPDYRIRRLKLEYYLEDGTFSAIEPRRDNSGLREGTFLRRLRVPKWTEEKGEDAGFIRHEDLRVGSVINVYGREIVIAGCSDDFTRAFYEREGLPQPDPITIPSDPPAPRSQGGLVNNIGITNKPYRVQETGIRRMRAKEAFRRLVQFLENDRHVLRFYAVWDGTDKEFGTREGYVLHYFLADDTVEVLEVKEDSDGKDPFPKLLHRMRLPKEHKGVPVTPPPADARFPPEPHVHWQDLRLGGTLLVFNRRLRLIDCDGFTRYFLSKVGGLSDEELQPVAVEDDRPSKRASKGEPPPHTGFGSEHDTLANWADPVRPKRVPVFPESRHSTSERIKFIARMVSSGGREPSKVDQTREFAVFVFLDDSTLEMHELPKENDGIRGGKFLERTVEPLRRRSGKGAPMAPRDYSIGSSFQVHSREFEVIGFDVHSLELMESQPEQFPRADFDRAVSKVKASASADRLKGNLESAPERVDAKLLKKLIQDAGCELHMHEALTIVRGISSESSSIAHPALAPTDIVRFLCS